MGITCQIGGKNYSLTHKSIDSNYQQDTFKRSELGVTIDTVVFVIKEVDGH